ncbi:Acyl-CoA dehydrogenase, C-terminal domain [Thermomonospora echinospora]|uniref:Acyl-CoA dehydrogenase, C-terminal domain n=1 Tax=Thermomonospora echinospora TaxID=1992 RepID=A0A1H6E6V0_9ACTN|nr:acyl-CoA dehydrogenase family protein [Thermomonospora echinospora]SEG92899.1 Acyl-CoA dehydrogenase, C-terminal domain [Thermomonospora echinospora]
MMDAETAELLAESLGRAFRHESVAAVEASLAEVGWREALQEEGAAVIPLLFTRQGAANATSGALDDLLTAALGLPADPGTAFVLPEFGTYGTPGRVQDGGLTVRGLGTARMPSAARAVLLAERDGALQAITVETGGLCTRPVGGVDPRLGLVAVEGQGVLASGSTAVTPAAWENALASGRVAVAYELIGASRAMLRLAREHAVTRIQFGRPIGTFQAVRHRLAECLVAIESAEAAAAIALGTGDRVSPLLAGMAKSLAGRNARTVARHCQQVLAGVGFTDEHDFHHYFRRVLTLDGLLGDARTLTRELGEELLRDRRLPAAPPL